VAGKRPGIEPLSPPALERWLIDFGLAEVDAHGLLSPTRRALADAGALDD
jgi:hypothetical protein